VFVCFMSACDKLAVVGVARIFAAGLVQGCNVVLRFVVLKGTRSGEPVQHLPNKFLSSFVWASYFLVYF